MAHSTTASAPPIRTSLAKRVVPSHLSERWSIALIAALLGITYAGLYLSVTLITTFGGSSGTTFWPAAGVTIAVLLRRPRTEWPLYLGVVWLVEFALDLWVSDVSVGISAGWATANTLEPTMAALLLTASVGRIDLSRQRDLLRFMAFAVFTGPAIGALIGTGTGAIAGFYDMWPSFPRWFAGDATGALVVAPMLLIDRRALLGRKQLLRQLGVPLAIGLAAVAATTPWDVSWDDPLPFLLVPMLVLAALRLDTGAVAISVGMVAFAINFMTASGHGPFALEDEVAGLMEAQAFLGATAFTALLVAALTKDLVSATEADENRTTLLQTVAHDLRGPLAAVSGLAETLHDSHDRLAPEDREEILTRIQATSTRLIGMVERLLAFERVMHERAEPRRRPTDLAAHLSATTDDIHHPDHPLTLDVTPLFANVDPDEVDRIVENLVANSVRHTPAGTPIWVRVAAVPGGIEIVVEDAGPGIEDELKDRMFRPFQSGHTSSPGAGIGLALVARLAARHDGRAWVEDRPGGGASFHVFLAADRIVTNGGDRD